MRRETRPHFAVNLEKAVFNRGEAPKCRATMRAAECVF